MSMRVCKVRQESTVFYCAVLRVLWAYVIACSASLRTQTDPTQMKVQQSTILKVADVSVDKNEEFGHIPVDYNSKSSVRGLPWTMDELLKLRAIDKTIIVLGGSGGYFDSIMNKVCNLRRLGISNFVIAAFDEEMYVRGFKFGLPVFLDIDQGVQARGKSEGSYGSKFFREITKVKSRVVLRILKKGYSVLWSDSDITWFKNPIPLLKSYNVDMAVQSNAPDSDAPNAARRINSGFFLVRSNSAMILAFNDVVQHASHSTLSEQPSFYDVLCCANKYAPHEKPGHCIKVRRIVLHLIESVSNPHCFYA